MSEQQLLSIAKCKTNLLYGQSPVTNQPNGETIAAMLETERISKDPSVKSYTNLEELFADLRK